MRSDLIQGMNDLPMPMSDRLATAIKEALRDARHELLDLIARDATLQEASSQAVVLAAPSARKHVYFGTSYVDDQGFKVKAGPVEHRGTFFRQPEYYAGRLLHRGSCWSVHEERQDVFGNEWSRHLPGYFVMDDFGDLVPGSEP